VNNKPTGLAAFSRKGVVAAPQVDEPTVEKVGAVRGRGKKEVVALTVRCHGRSGSGCTSSQRLRAPAFKRWPCRGCRGSLLSAAYRGWMLEGWRHGVMASWRHGVMASIWMLCELKYHTEAT